MRPVIPTAPTRSPPDTRSPSDTDADDMWAYRVVLPSACRIVTWMPAQPAEFEPAWVTTPGAAARMSVPMPAEKSMPVWYRDQEPVSPKRAATR